MDGVKVKVVNLRVKGGNIYMYVCGMSIGGARLWFSGYWEIMNLVGYTVCLCLEEHQ